MTLERLQIFDFRNFKEHALDCHPKINILFGVNGVGKTNLLEALSLFSPGRGFRRASYNVMARTGGSGSWILNLRLNNTASGSLTLGTAHDKGDKGRKIRVDGENRKSSEAFTEYLSISWMTPIMDGIFLASPGERRQFLDRMIFAIQNDHAMHLLQFEKLLKNRNRLLEEKASDAYLEAVEKPLAFAASKVCSARFAFLKSLEPYLIAQNHEHLLLLPLLSLQGEMDELSMGKSQPEIEALYLEMLLRNRPRERAAGRTLSGPHRSDLIIRDKYKGQLAQNTSTGEQKTLLLTIFLAHIALTRDIKHQSPLLLLDEVAAHFDIHKRRILFQMIAKTGCQTFITGTNRADFEDISSDSAFYEMKK